MTKREDQLKERIHDVEEMLVKAAVMVTEAREEAARNWQEYLGERAARMEANTREQAIDYWKAKAEAAEANEREASAQWKRLLENYASADARAEAAEKHVKDQQELKVRYFDERNKWKTRAEAAEKRVRELEDEIERMNYEYRNTEPI